MTIHHLLKPAIAGAMAAFVFASAPAPVMAAPADVEFLKSYIGSWKGRGTTTSESGEETVVCRLDVTDAQGGKVNYKGRCSVAGATLSVTGTMAYVDESSRYEAVMSTNTSFSGVAIGRRSGQGLDFRLRDRDPESGAELEVNTAMALKSDMIQIDLDVTNHTNGKKITASVPFEK